MATNKQEQRSLWKRLTEKVKTLRPIEPGSYEARELSMDTQRENAINWLSAQSHKDRSKIEFGAEITTHILNDVEFAVLFNERFGDKLADRVVPQEVKRSTEYQAKTVDCQIFLNAALQYDEASLQLPVKDHGMEYSLEDKRHALERVRSLDSKEALDLISNYITVWSWDSKTERDVLNALSDEVLTNREFLIGMDDAGFHPKNLPAHILNDDDLMRSLIPDAPIYFQVASETVRSDQQLFEKSMEKTLYSGMFLKEFQFYDAAELFAQNYKAAGPNVRENADTFLNLDEHYFLNLSPRDLPESIRNNKEVIENFLREDSDGLRFASRELRKDKSFILEMTSKYQIDVSRETLFRDRKVALNLAKTDSVLLTKLPENLQNDRNFVEDLVRLNGQQFEGAKEEFRDDYVIARFAVQQQGGNLEFVSERLRADPTIVEIAIERNGFSIAYASEAIQNDKNFAMQAVQGAPYALSVLKPEFKSDLDILQMVAEQRPAALVYASDSTKATMLNALGAIERSEYEEYWLTQPDKESPVLGEFLAKGLEAHMIKLERDHLQAEIEQYQEVHLRGVLDSANLSKREDIATWLNHYKVSNYTINDDLTVDVRGDVGLKSKYTGGEIGTDEYVGEQLSHTVIPEKLSVIPFQFGKVEGNFDISDNSYGHEYMDAIGLRSLKGSPIEVKGTFDCSNNANLSSLEHAPKTVGGDFNVSHTQLRSLDSAPQVSGRIVADGMPQIKREVESHNSKLTSKIASFRSVSPEEAAAAMAAVPRTTQAPATAQKTKLKMKI